MRTRHEGTCLRAGKGAPTRSGPGCAGSRRRWRLPAKPPRPRCTESPSSPGQHRRARTAHPDAPAASTKEAGLSPGPQREHSIQTQPPRNQRATHSACPLLCPRDLPQSQLCTCQARRSKGLPVVLFLTHLIPLIRLFMPLRDNSRSWLQLTEQTKIIKIKKKSS